jgi:hypothetical protein
MAHYIQFRDENGSIILVETSESEISSEEGIVKAGLGDIPKRAVVAAQTLFEQAVNGIIQQNARAFLQAVRNLPEQDQPSSMEVQFALKATGEFGNAAIARGTGEANYTITLTWRRADGH